MCNPTKICQKHIQSLFNSDNNNGYFIRNIFSRMPTEQLAKYLQVFLKNVPQNNTFYTRHNFPKKSYVFQSNQT